MSDIEVSSAVLRRRIIPVVVIKELETALPLAEALADGWAAGRRGHLPHGGRRRRDPAARRRDGSPRRGRDGRPARQVDLAVEAGARFIVSPGFSAAVVERCREPDVLVIPGVATATEVIAALDHGLDLLKFFPAEAAGGVALPAGAAGAVPERSLDPDRRGERGERCLLPRAAVRRRRRRQLDGGAGADRSPGLRRRRPPGAGGRRSRRRGGHDERPRDPAGRGVPLRPRRARRGHAPPRPGRGPHPHRPRSSRSGRAAASTTSPAACAAASACARRSSPRSPTTTSAGCSRTSSSRAASTRRCIHWVPFDGIGRTVRNGLNFTERGFGVRGAVGVSDRGNTAASQLKPGDVDWEHLFGTLGVRWFHTGGIFAALSETTPRGGRGGGRRGAGARHDRVLRPQLPAQPLEGDRRRRAGAGGEPPARRGTST